MNLHETRALLSIVHNEDARWRSQHRDLSGDGARRLAESWRNALVDVDAGFAHDFTQRWYASVEKRRQILSHADIVKGWREQQRRSDRPPSADEPVAAIGEVVDGIGAPPAGYREWVAEMAVAADRVRSQGVAVMDAACAEVDRPASMLHPRTPTTAQQENDRWWRRCRHDDVCACSHTECRDGWLDAEVDAPIPGRPGRTVVQKCPRCTDAIEMSGERRRR